MKVVSNRSWKKVNTEQFTKIEEFLESIQAKKDAEAKSATEVWRYRYSDATITGYTKGTVYITDSEDESVLKIHEGINDIVGLKYIPTTKKISIGFDETGKGEVLGHTILTGVIFSTDITTGIERDLGVADSKVKHEPAYWDTIFRKLDYYTRKGLSFTIEKIPPWYVDKYNLNKLLDITYQRMLLSMSRDVDLSQTRIIIDDYGAGFHLKNFLKTLENQGAEVVLESKADENYLESRVASIIAKREQQRVMEAISKDPEFQIEGIPLGSGNAGDPKTIEWLKAWKKTGRTWPWFVKTSFKTIRDIAGLKEVKKQTPSINEELLSDEFRKKFESGKLDITSLSVVCPSCGDICKSVKIVPLNNQTTPLCTSCGKEIHNLSLVLQCYCGEIIPDTSAIVRGMLSKDLEAKRFFENFTFLLTPVVRYESDKYPGSKKEVERLGRFASIGRIRLKEVGGLKNYDDMDSTLKDEEIMNAAVRYNAMLLTNDSDMKGSAQAKNIFVIELG